MSLWTFCQNVDTLSPSEFLSEDGRAVLPLGSELEQVQVRSAPSSPQQSTLGWTEWLHGPRTVTFLSLVLHLFQADDLEGHHFLGAIANFLDTFPNLPGLGKSSQDLPRNAGGQVPSRALSPSIANRPPFPQSQEAL